MACASNAYVPPQSPEIGAGKGVLVVDDDRDTCTFMRVALEGAGYEVRTASDGGQALALQGERCADLLITDIFMPGVEGMETIWRCKNRFPPTRIVAMSAGGSVGGHDVLSTATLLGVAATLAKPFSADELLETVRRALSVQP